MTPKTVKEGVREFNRAVGNPFREENPYLDMEVLKALKDWSRRGGNPLLPGPCIYPGQEWSCGELEGVFRSYAPTPPWGSVKIL